MTADLSALIARLEAAEVGSLGLDSAVCDALNWRRTDGVWRFPAPVSQSLDAVLALAERVLEGWSFGLHGEIGGGALATLEQPDVDLGSGVIASPGLSGLDEFEGEAATPALALCIAILRAKQGEGE